MGLSPSTSLPPVQAIVTKSEAPCAVA